jgi:hypothetical protein
MIGTLHLSQGSHPRQAELTDDLIWVSDDADLQDRLNRIVPGEPADDLPATVIGRHMLYQAAERLNGRVTVHFRRVPQPA